MVLLTRRPTAAGGSRVRAVGAGAVLVVGVGLLAVTADGTPRGSAEPTGRPQGAVPVAARRDEAPPSMREQLQAEVDSLLRAGVPPDDPKMEILREDLLAPEAPAEEATDEPAGPDPGEMWEDGPVGCEPVPPAIRVEDIEGARCRVEPLPQGGARYIAVAPDGTEHEALFGRAGPAGTRPGPAAR